MARNVYKKTELEFISEVCCEIVNSEIAEIIKKRIAQNLLKKVNHRLRLSSPIELRSTMS